MKINPFNRKSKPEAVASTAVQKTADGAHVAIDRTAEFIENALQQLTPLLVSAKDAAAERAAGLQQTVQPRLNDAVGLVGPRVDQARAKVQNDFVPKLVTLLEEAQANPAVHEAQKRSMATMAALKGDLALPEPEPVKKRSVVGTVAKVAAVSALVAGVAVAVRQFLAGRDADWTAHEPSTGYTAPTLADETITETTEKVVAEQTWDDEAPQTDQADSAMDAAEMGDAPVVGDAVAGDTAASDAPAGERTYGDGAYIGDNPPEGYTIKGNERSMKFHTADSAGYERTIADVWFNSEAAAEEAGFTRAQR